MYNYVLKLEILYKWGRQLSKNVIITSLFKTFFINIINPFPQAFYGWDKYVLSSSQKQKGLFTEINNWYY